MSSPKTSVIVHPAETPLVILRADYLRICNGLQCEAILLNVFEHWRNSVGEKWIYRTIDQLVEDMCGIYKYTRVKKAIKWLVDNHRIYQRHNPERKNDRTYQYWFNAEYVQALVDDFFPNRYFQRLEPLKVTDATVKSNGTIQETQNETQNQSLSASADETQEGQPNTPEQEGEDESVKQGTPISSGEGSHNNNDIPEHQRVYEMAYAFAVYKDSAQPENDTPTYIGRKNSGVIGQFAKAHPDMTPDYFNEFLNCLN